MQTRSQIGRPRLVIHLPRRAASTSMARQSDTAFDDGPGSQQTLGSAAPGCEELEGGMAPEERPATERRAGSPGASEGHSPQVNHHYGTRRSTQTAHRAHALGSRPSTRGGLSQAAAERSSVKQSQQGTRTSKTQKRSQGMQELAKLEDQRIAEEAAEDEAMYMDAAASTTLGSGHNASAISATSARANQLDITRTHGSASPLVQRPSRRWDETSDSEDDLAQAVAAIKSAGKTKREIQAIAKRAKKTRPLSPTPSPERRAHFEFRIPPNADAEALARRRRERRKRATDPVANSGSEDFEDNVNKHEGEYEEDGQPDRYIDGNEDHNEDQFVDEYGQGVYGDGTEDITEEADGDGQTVEYADDELNEPDGWGEQDEDRLQDEDELQDDGEDEDEPVDDELQNDDESQEDDEFQDDDELQDDDEQEQVEDEEEMPQRQSGLTYAQRRRMKRINIRQQIDSYSERASTGRHTLKRRRESSSPAPRSPVRAKRGKNHQGDAFRPNWQKTQPQRGPTQLQQARTTSSKHQIARTVHWRDAAQPRNHPVDMSDDERASSGTEAHAARVAFRDTDVAVDHASAVAQAARRSKMKVVVETVDDEDASETERTGQNPRHKRPRRSPSEVPEDESRSTVNVPHFIKPVLTSKIIPTVLDYFGAKKNPWNMMEHGRTELLDLCQQLIDDSCPRANYELTKSDIVYKVIRQAVYDWRAGFANTAVSAVDAAIDQKFGPKPNRKIVKLWVRKATSTGGESLWAKPHTKPERARGALQSKYVLKAFAHHLTATEGSMYDFGYPCGALALAATAVKHIFPMFASGTFKAGKSFSAANVEHITDSWYRKRVRRLVKKPEVFLAIIRMASRHTDTSGVRRTPTGAADVPDIFDRSSSPVRVEEDDMDI